MLERIFPFLVWRKRVTRKTFLADFVAGITGAVIVLPQGVAFSLIAGMPPIYGLYAAMVFPIVTALFGSSWHMITGPATAISIVIFASISEFAEPMSQDFVRLAFSLTLMTGVIQLIMGIARLGVLVNFVSHTIIIGFTAGAALLIATSQVKHVLGVQLPEGEGFVQTWISIVNKLPETNLYVLAVGLITLVVAILFKWISRKSPYMLIAMVVGSVAAIFLGGEEVGIELVGQLPGKLPPFALPDMSLASVQMLAPSAIALALLGLIEAVAIARAIATQSKQKIDGNQEFIGQGLANIIGSLFSSYAGSGSFTRSGVNFQAGAQTPLSAIFSAILLALMLLLVAPLTAYLPIPAMGGLILLVAYNLIDIKHIIEIFKISKQELLILMTTFFATIFLDLEFAIYVGVFLSILIFLYNQSKPDVQVVQKQRAGYPEIIRKDGLKELEIRGPLFFGSVHAISNEIQKCTDSEYPYLIIDCSKISELDLAGADLLVQESLRLKNLGGDLYLVNVPEAMNKKLDKGTYREDLGKENIFSTSETATESLSL